MKISVALTVNGKPVSAEVAAQTLLVDFLRENLQLTGTHVGCDTAQCGACTILLDGKAVKSCNVLAVQAQGAKLTTIEGLATNGSLHPMQEAFKRHHGLQCGFCTPGMVLAAVGLAAQFKEPTEAQIREALDGNFCRCTGYHNIVKAVKSGIEEMTT
jgi:aerobic carbon-monoxide dehydrogenase small subunit